LNYPKTIGTGVWNVNCSHLYAGKLLPAGQCYFAHGGIQNKEILWTLYLAKPRWNAKVFLKTYALFSYGDIQYLIIAISAQAWTSPESSRRLRLPDFKTIGTWMW